MSGTTIDGLRWRPAWTTHIGCLEACLDHLGVGASRAWVFGGLGHAFLANVHDEVCPSGPTAWKTFMIHELAPNLGGRTEVSFAVRTQPDFAVRQEEAWRFVRARIDEGTPCYGWELKIPEYYLIHGYDASGYLFRGCDAEGGGGPKAWRELGLSEIGCLEVCAVRACEPAPEGRVVKDALAAALRHAEGPADWVFPRYAQGPKAFQVWAAALETGVAHDMGHRYNAAVWAECREQACAFLEEAGERLSSALLDEAREHYGVVADRLCAVRDLHPFAERTAERLSSREAAELVRQAGAAEAKGLSALRRVVDAL